MCSSDLFRTFAEVVQGFHGRTEDRKKPKQLGVTVKGKIPQIGEEKMGGKIPQIRCFRGHRLSVSYLIFF